TKVSGEVSKRITVAGSSACTAGISQDGLFVDRAEPCEFRCWLRAEGMRGGSARVRVRLHREEHEFAAVEFAPGAEWKKFTARLAPSGGAPDATLTIEFRGPGTVWLDNASLMPVDTVGGWRRDVVASVRSLRPGVIRFGGSA